ncbi:hypothetical protein [Halopseudomonas salegens]|uniref:hypothetical protein n=1 Tax=Halopseudomonas salegens TaxID=1434072 RepID=UPI0012FD7FCD|nr:hypothetical protein [Halopseudomonas salegens]
MFMLAAGLISPFANAAKSDSEKTLAAFEAFTSAPSKITQQALMQYFSQQATHPITERTPEFEQMVLEGHPLALEVAFECMGYTDGAESLHLRWLIGQSIMSNPEGFLKAVTKYRHTIQRLGALVGYLGPDYVDNLSASILGLEERYMALRDIDSPEYSEARDEVLLALSKRIYQRREQMQEISSDSELRHD